MFKKIFIAIIFFLIAFPGFSQVNEDRLKASMLYYISDFIIWPANKKPVFSIGILGKNEIVKGELSLIAKSKKMKGKLIVIREYNTIQEIENVDLLYVNTSLNKEMSEISPVIRAKGILLVTDKMENNLLTMINFVNVEGNSKIAFEVNKQNLILAGFDYQEELLLYGGTEVDIKELYRATRKLLEEESSNVAILSQENLEKQNEIIVKNRQIEVLEKNIQSANDTLVRLNDTIRTQNHNLKLGNQQLSQQMNEFDKVRFKYNSLTNSYNKLNNEISNQTNHLQELNAVIGDREKTIKSQSDTINQKELLLKTERKLSYLVGLVSVAILIIGLMILRAYIIKRRYNSVLEHKVEERTQELKTSNENLISEIEERKKYELKLASSERNYREIFNATSEAIFIHDIANSDIIDVNEPMLAMYGYSKNELLTLSFKDLCAGVEPYTEFNGRKLISDAVEKGALSFEWLARKKNGELFWCDVSLKNTNIGGADRVLAVVRDIDEKKKIAIELEDYRKNLEVLVAERTRELQVSSEELVSTIDELNVVNHHLESQKGELEITLDKLKDAQMQLLQSEKLASLGVFTAGIAHEINNPVNFIASGSSALFQVIESLKSKLDLSEPTFQTLFEEIAIIQNAVETGIERTTAIISSLRNYSRSNDKEFIKYNSINCINDALLLLHNNYKYNIIIKRELPEVLELECIPGRLNQLFVNILSNAIQSIEKEGTINISSKVVENKFVKFEFSDTGCGIPPEIIDKIFDPFFTTKSTGKGTGLGLYIVHGIIEEHKGLIEVKSQPGIGSEFIITLPLTQII